MSIEVIATQRAKQQIDALSDIESRSVTAFLNDLAATGCAALGYRLTGDTPLDRICVNICATP